MVNAIQIIIIILAGVSVGVADALIKRTTSSGSMLSVFSHPLTVLIFTLYLAQVVLFAYVFSNNWSLGIAGNAQMVFYSITVVLLGVLLFGEKMTVTQGLGILLALAGVMLMNA